jgi:hydroxypyruvate isomerase
LLFAEGAPPVADRIRAAARAGCEGVELWTWRDKPLDTIAEVVAETGVAIPLIVVQAQGRHTVEPADSPSFLAAVFESAQAASRIGCRALVTVSGKERPDASPEEQDDAIVAALRDAAPIVREHGIELLLEPLNRSDHPGVRLSTTPHGLDLVERVDRPEIRLLHDVYHSAVMGEQTATVLAGRGELVGHVHVADTPDRHQPGTGDIDWPLTIGALRGAGYRGFLGLEYLPTIESTDSMQALKRAIVDSTAGA